MGGYSTGFFFLASLGSTLVVTCAPTGSMAHVSTSQRSRLVSSTPTFVRIVANSKRTHQRSCTACVAHLTMKTSESREEGHIDNENGRKVVW